MGYSDRTWAGVGPILNQLGVDYGSDGVPTLEEARALLDAVEAIHRGIAERSATR